MENQKIVACFETSLMITSIFAFAFLIGNYGEFFDKSDDKEGNFLIKENRLFFDKIKENNSDSLIKKVIFKLSSPMIPLVSAVGCCETSNDGLSCVSNEAQDCSPSVHYSPGVECVSTSFCSSGCCYDEAAGIYSANVLQKDCSAQWDGTDPFCNQDGAELGCCVLGLDTRYVTQGACEVFTSMALVSDAQVNWMNGLTLNQCILYRTNQEQGACISGDNSCEFTTQVNCLSQGNRFSINSLCTAESLNTTCEKTNLTTCVNGRDQVYFTDSCGNIANIYDSSKALDQTYWETIINAEDSCDYNNGEGNANSLSCGNCHRFAGGFCSNALENDFEVDLGGNYCKPTSCLYEEETYKNGESFCVYDGKVGDGDDVPGSLHRSLYCDYGEMDTLLCGDYRNEICATKDTYIVNGSTIEFRDSECLLNPWRNCLSINNRGGDLKEACEAAPYCTLKKEKLADEFEFEVCTPAYPAGFGFTNERSGNSVCALATKTCIVLREGKLDQKCHYLENEDCLYPEFTEGMNDLCRSLGDCGLSANIAGRYTKNYDIKEGGDVGSSYISNLVKLADNIDNHVPWINLDPLKSFLSTEEVSGLDMGGGGSSGAGSSNAAMTAVIALAAIYATAYAALGGYLGATVGYIAGAAASAFASTPVGAVLAPLLGPLLFVVIIILIILMLLQPECPPIVVEFTCNPWVPPTGGDDCEICNDNLEICTEYRCTSLGAACGIINRGSVEQACVNFASGDVIAPIMNPSENINYSSLGILIGENANGHNITNLNGGCLEANNIIPINVATDERTQCKYAFEQTGWENMTYLGGTYYTLEHTILIQLPNPNHGQSLGLNVTEDLDIYVQCKDINGNKAPVFPEFYIINMCVNQGPDITPPVIYTYYPQNSSFVSINSTIGFIGVTTNELSTCRWSNVDQDYSLMENEMICDDELLRPSSAWGYVCADNVSITGMTNNHFIRCMDQPWLRGTENETKRNAMQESQQITFIKPDKKIQIDSALPKDKIEIKGYVGTVNIEVVTSGGGNFPWCKYSFNGWGSLVGDTLSDGDSLHNHKKALSLGVGNQTVYIECFDETGDGDRKIINFEIIHLPIQIESITPNGKVEIESDYGSFDLEVRTSAGGYHHSCSYSTSGYDSLVKMTETNLSQIHKERGINLLKGYRTFYVECVDETGDFVRDTAPFEIVHDTSVTLPQIARVFQEGNSIRIITVSPSECRYTSLENLGCGFNWANGTSIGNGETHNINSIKGDTYYIKCQDESEIAPLGCSMIVEAA